MRKKDYTLMGADGKAYTSEAPGQLGGHRRSKIYGELDCPTASTWIAKGHYVSQRVFFASESDAILAGFRPCSRCRPEDYADWKSDPEAFRRAKIGAR